MANRRGGNNKKQQQEEEIVTVEDSDDIVMVGSDSDADDDDDDDIPDAITCQRLVEQFASLTNTDEACAQFYLQDRDWDLELSVNAFFESNKEDEVRTLRKVEEDQEVVVTFDSKLVSVVERGVMTETPPKTFTFITWNVDGLDETNLKKRTKTVAKVIDVEKADIVFLQEVVPHTFTYLQELLPHYKFLYGGEDGSNSVGKYFIVTLLRLTTVHYDNHTLIPYQMTQMKRNLLSVQAHIGDLKLNLLNTHLESMAEFSNVRIEQLKFALKRMLKTQENVTSIFGGDLNLRDKELASIGLPPGVKDLWEECGERGECKYTWDTYINTNKQFGGRFKPRLRFDRVYLRQPAATTAATAATTTTATPRHFGLVGLEKVTNTQSFPSDHWGIIVHFEIGQPGGSSSSSSGGGSSSSGGGSSSSSGAASSLS